MINFILLFLSLGFAAVAIWFVLASFWVQFGKIRCSTAYIAVIVGYALLSGICLYLSKTVLQ